MPSMILEHAIHVYTRDGYLKRTADKLIEIQFMIDDRPLEAKFVSALLLCKPSSDDLLFDDFRRKKLMHVIDTQERVGQTLINALKKTKIGSG